MASSVRPILASRMAEVVVGFGMIGVKFQCLQVMSHGLVGSSHLRKQKAEVEMSFAIVGVSFPMPSGNEP